MSWYRWTVSARKRLAGVSTRNTHTHFQFDSRGYWLWFTWINAIIYKASARMEEMRRVRKKALSLSLIVERRRRQRVQSVRAYILNDEVTLVLYLFYQISQSYARIILPLSRLSNCHSIIIQRLGKNTSDIRKSCFVTSPRAPRFSSFLSIIFSIFSLLSRS